MFQYENVTVSRTSQTQIALEKRLCLHPQSRRVVNPGVDTNTVSNLGRELIHLKSLSPCLKVIFQPDEFLGCTAQAVLMAQKRQLRTGEYECRFSSTLACSTRKTCMLKYRIYFILVLYKRNLVKQARLKMTSALQGEEKQRVHMGRRREGSTSFHSSYFGHQATGYSLLWYFQIVLKFHQKVIYRTSSKPLYLFTSPV